MTSNTAFVCSVVVYTHYRQKYSECQNDVERHKMAQREAAIFIKMSNSSLVGKIHNLLSMISSLSKEHPIALLLLGK